MSYDLHIVRTEDWTEAARSPITKQDVDALIAADSELAWSTTDYVEMLDEPGLSTRYYMIEWREHPCFWWYRDEIRCCGPNEEQLLKLIQMARALNAYAVGDNGEIYPLEPETAIRPVEQNSATKPTLTLTKPWPLWKPARPSN